MKVLNSTAIFLLSRKKNGWSIASDADIRDRERGSAAQLSSNLASRRFSPGVPSQYNVHDQNNKYLILILEVSSGSLLHSFIPRSIILLFRDIHCVL